MDPLLRCLPPCICSSDDTISASCFRSGRPSFRREKSFLKEALNKSSAEAQARTADVDRQRGEVCINYDAVLFVWNPWSI